jgi:hypothetical protein
MREVGKDKPFGETEGDWNEEEADASRASVDTKNPPQNSK